MRKILNHIYNFISKDLTPKKEFHVDYDGFNALVEETNNKTIYYVIGTDLENKKFTLDILEFTNDLELLKKEHFKLNTLLLAKEIISDRILTLPTNEA